MNESKYNSFLTILLIIIIIAIIGCLAFGGYQVYQQINATKDANNYVSDFLENTVTNTVPEQNQIKNDIIDNSNPQGNEVTDGNEIYQIENTPQGSGSGSSSEKEKTYKGFAVIGTIEIPEIKLSYPILKEATTAAIEKSVGMLYGVGPNNPGNTLIIGHNRRNGQFFANNKNLAIGDKIYITDLSGKRLSYTIYDKFETTTEDTEFITRDTNGAREISLQTCTDNGALRLIILAKCDLDS